MGTGEWLKSDVTLTFRTGFQCPRQALAECCVTTEVVACIEGSVVINEIPDHLDE